VTGGWEKLRNEELRDLYSSPSIFRMIKSRMRLVWHVNDIKMDLGEIIMWGGIDWISLAQDKNKWRAL
jgi:hypothetical protein